MKRGEPAVGLTAKETSVDIRIIASETGAERAQSLVDSTEAAIRERLGDAVYSVDGQPMEEVVGALLKQRRLKLSVAESCTGGLIGARITNIAGSSEYFERAAVTYSNPAKTEMLGVPGALLERYGAVSSEVAAAMARGSRPRRRTSGFRSPVSPAPTAAPSKSPWGSCTPRSRAPRESRPMSIDFLETESRCA
jgi:nicotinamide-nucleotide amidase